MRKTSEDILGENLEALTAPLTFRLQDGGEEIHPAPMAFVPNLWVKIEELLNHNDDREQGYIHELAYITPNLYTVVLRLEFGFKPTL